MTFFASKLNDKKTSFILRGFGREEPAHMTGANFKSFSDFIPQDIAEGFISACNPRVSPCYYKSQDGELVEIDNKRVVSIPGFGDAVSYIGANSFTPHDTMKYIAEPLSRFVDNERIGYVQVAAVDNGGRIIAQIGQNEASTSTEGGVKYRMAMTAVGGHDGKTGSYFDPNWPRIISCQNEIPALISTADNQRLKVRHSRYGIERIEAITDLGGDLDKAASKANATISEMVTQRIGEAQFERFVAKLFPKPEPAKDKDEASKAAMTRWENSVEAVKKLYTEDARAAEWKGTAWGAFQAVNTYQQHEAPTRGADRTTRTLQNVTGDAQMNDDFATLRVLREMAYA